MQPIASVSSPAIPDTLTIMFSTKTEVFAQAMTDRQTLVKPVNNETGPYSNNLSPSDTIEEWNRIFDSYAGSQTNQSALPSFGENFKIRHPILPRSKKSQQAMQTLKNFLKMGIKDPKHWQLFCQEL